MAVRTLKLTIAYEGTDFAGWQRQTGVRTVQADIEDAIAPIEGGRVVITGAGRTDAGVHAAAQTASVRLRSPLPLDVLRRAINAALQPDVRILAIEDAAPEFNAQFAARSKTYHYDIWSAGVLPPVWRKTTWFIPQALDVAAMRTAIEEIVGVHDFAAFQAAGSDVVTTVREVLSAQVLVLDAEAPAASGMAAGQWLRLAITGRGFLRHMVRNLAGTLVEIGRGWRPVDDLSRVLATRTRAEAGATAPPHGLTLWRVDY